MTVKAHLNSLTGAATFGSMTSDSQVDTAAQEHTGVLPPAVRWLLIARFVNRLGAFSMPFLAVLLVQDHQASMRTAGFVVAAFGVATIPSRLLGGRLATSTGTKTASVLGLTGTAAAQLLIAAAPTLPAALLGAVLLGLCFEIYEPASQTLIADVTPDPLLPRAYGLLGATLAIAGVAAGLLAAGVGRWGLRWLFVIDAATCLGCAVLLAARLPPTPRTFTRGSAPLALPWRDGRLALLMVTGTAFATVYMTIPMALPVALSHIGRPPSDAGLLFAMGAVVIVGIQPVMTKTGTPHVRVVLGYVLIAAGAVVAAAAPSMTGLVSAMVLVSAGDALLLGYAYTLVARIAPAGAKAGYFAAYGLTWGIALSVGPAVMGSVLDQGATLYWYLAALTMGVLGITHQACRGRLDRSP